MLLFVLFIFTKTSIICLELDFVLFKSFWLFS